MSAVQLETDRPLYSSLASELELHELVAQYVEQIPSQIIELQQQFDLGNLVELQRLVHRMKGTAGSYGFDYVTPAAARLEQTICLGSNAEIKTALEQLLAICARLRAGSATQSTKR